jgi:hypothetical protein
MRATESVSSLSDARTDGLDRREPDPRRAFRRWAAALVLLCGATLWLEFGHIQDSMPYPLDVDEAFVTGPALRTVQTGTWHPYTFNYPSLPKYLAAAGMAVGFLRGASHREIGEVRHIGSGTFPYYGTPRVIQTARQLFVILSVIALAATGFLAWLVLRRPAALLLAPVIVLTTPLFFGHSWMYLNVDIVGTCFVVLTLVACQVAAARPSIGQSAVLPGLLAGLATGSKYTLALVILPVLVGIGFSFSGLRRIRAWATALAAMIGAFIAVVPYSLIDLPGFLNGVASEAFHYASGHRGFNEEPGLPQLLFYLGHFVSEFGPAGAMLALLGIASFVRADWRRTAVLAIFPVGLLWLLASHRVHFPRNVLSLHPLVAIFATSGLLALHNGSLALAARRGWVRQPVTVRMSTLVGLALLLVAVPVWHVPALFRDRTDSRNLARTWIEERLTPEWTIVIPNQLNFDARPLERAGRRVVRVDLRAARDVNALNSLTADVPSPAVILVPRWGADRRFSGQEVAAKLNELAPRWRAVRTFGNEAVRVNYSSSTPRGNPAFSIAVLK